MSSNDFFVAEEFLRQLKPIRQTADAGVIFETHVLEIELLMRQGKLSSAFDCIEKQVVEAKAADSAGTKIVHNEVTGLTDI
jgi:anaphase-promoting complex subunit 5